MNNGIIALGSNLNELEIVPSTEPHTICQLDAQESSEDRHLTMTPLVRATQRAASTIRSDVVNPYANKPFPQSSILNGNSPSVDLWLDGRLFGESQGVWMTAINRTAPDFTRIHFLPRHHLLPSSCPSFGPYCGAKKGSFLTKYFN